MKPTTQQSGQAIPVRNTIANSLLDWITYFIIIIILIFFMLRAFFISKKNKKGG